MLARVDAARRRGRFPLLLSAAVVVLLAASLAVAAERVIREEERPAGVVASRVIDRTLLCETGFRAGVYVVELHGSSSKPGTDSAGIYARTSVLPTWRLAYIGEGEVLLSPACRRSTARVPLTSRGLAGGVADRFGDELDCWTPRRVLIRVRAVFRSPVALRRSRLYGFPELFARGKVKEASLAMRTPAGKPLAFATVSETGRARLFTSRHDCFPD